MDPLNQNKRLPNDGRPPANCPDVLGSWEVVRVPQVLFWPALPQTFKPKPKIWPFCSKQNSLPGTLVFQELPDKRLRKGFLPLIRTQIGGERLGVFCIGAVLYARIGHEWAVVPATHNRIDYRRGPLRFVAASAGETLYGAFFHDNGEHLYRQSCFAVARNKARMLFGENRTQDRITISWLQQEFGIRTPNVLWPVTRATFTQTSQSYTTFREPQALQGSRIEAIAAIERQGSSSVELCRVTRANCAAGYPEDALVIVIGQRSIPVPQPDTFLSGWIGGDTIYIGREGAGLVVALYDASNPTTPAMRERCVFALY